MKISKLCLLPLFALAMAACAPTVSESTTVPSSSETPSETSTELAPVPTEWTAEEIEAQKYFLNENVLPFFYVDGGKWVADETLGFVYVKLEGATMADGEKVAEVFASNESFVDLSKSPDLDLQPGQWMFVQALPLFETRSEMILVSLMVLPEDGILVVQPMYFIDPWVEEEVNAKVSEILGVEAVLPKPEFEVFDILYVQLPLFEANVKEDVVALMVEDVEAAVQSYAVTLTEAGFVMKKQAKLNAYFVDPTNTYAYAFVPLTDDKGNFIAFGIMPVLVADYPEGNAPAPIDPTKEWTKEDVDLMKQHLGEELPFFGFQGTLTESAGVLTFTAPGAAAQANQASVLLKTSGYTETTAEGAEVRTFEKAVTGGTIKVSVKLDGANVVVTAQKVAA